MDSMYDLAGAQASAAFHGVLWSLGLPLIVALAGVAWRVHRVAEDGAVRPLAFYILSLFMIVWFLKPVPDGPPRFVAWLDDATGLAVRRAIGVVNRDFLSKPFEYERRMALLEAVRVKDPAVREELHIFFATCVANAMARTDEVEPGNPLRPGTAMKYDGLHFGRTPEPCDGARARIWEAVHKDAITAWFGGNRSGASHEDILDAIVDNEWHGRALGASEMAMVRGAVGDYQAAMDREAARRGAWVAHRGSGIDVIDAPFSFGAEVLEAVKGYWGMAGQFVGDQVTSRQRYYAVTAYAPITYGLILMLLTVFFPVAGLWSLFPGKWTALVNFAKVYVSVKLWPLGWSILTVFTQHRPVDDGSVTSHSDVFVAVSLLYFVVPALTFLVVNVAARAAAAPFAEAPVVGPSNGPVGQAAAMAAGRIR